MTFNRFDPPPQLAALMTRQLGVFTAEQAYAAGYIHFEIQRLRKRSLLSVRRGVYAVRASYDGLDPISRHRVDTQAALLVLTSPTTLSHETAAIWSGLELLQPSLDVLHVTRPELRASRLEAGIHHHPGSLPDGHARRLGSVALTDDSRTAVDVARTNDFPCGLAAVDSALRAGTRPSDLREVLFYCASWPGARGASRAVAAGDGRAANPGESWSRAALIAAGLEPTQLQFPVRDSGGLIGYADFAWWPVRVLGEFDGRWKYGTDPASAALAVWREKKREDRLRAQGYEVVRWTWSDLFATDRVPAAVRSALSRAESRQSPGA